MSSCCLTTIISTRTEDRALLRCNLNAVPGARTEGRRSSTAHLPSNSTKTARDFGTMRSTFVARCHDSFDRMSLAVSRYPGSNTIPVTPEPTQVLISILLLQRLRQCHVPDFCASGLAFRSSHFECHDEFAGLLIMMDRMTICGSCSVAEIPQPRGELSE